MVLTSGFARAASDPAVDRVRPLITFRCADPDPGLSYRHPVHQRNMVRVYNDARRRGLTIAEQCSTIIVTAKRGRTGTTLSRDIVLKFPPDKAPSTTESEFLFDEVLEKQREGKLVREDAIHLHEQLEAMEARGALPPRLKVLKEELGALRTAEAEARSAKEERAA